MSCEAEALTLVRTAGHKLTPQRVLVVSVLRHAERHLTAVEILKRVKADYPYVDAGTVTRTVTVLKDLHLVSETDFGFGEPAYEWLLDNRHHHLVCEDCGSIQRLENQALVHLGEELLQNNHFAANIDHFAIFGRCSACASRLTDG